MKTYRNSERTKKWIRRAFTELLAEKKSIDKITVNELAKRADITKTTFYYHYEDLYAVAEEFENELIDELNVTMDNIIKENPSDYSLYFNKVLAFLKQHEDNYRLAVNASELDVFAGKLKVIFTRKMAVVGIQFGFSTDERKRLVQVFFFVNATVDTVIQYFRGELNVPIEVVGQVVTEAAEKLKRQD